MGNSSSKVVAARYVIPFVALSRARNAVTNAAASSAAGSLADALIELSCLM
jgi:hypothetical protein